MGLLSDPEYGSARWARALRRVHAAVGVLCFAAALGWFALLAHRDFNNETYFSENALLPGLVTNEFNAEHAAKHYYRELVNEMEEKYPMSGMPVPWLVAKMSQLHLEVYTHNFTLHYPLGSGQVFTGTNVYGILRAARTPSLEALVVTAPARALSSHQKSTAAGIALMLAFAEFAAPQKYWAKDIIFLFTEHEQLGMQAWLEAYHGVDGDAEGFYSSLGSFWRGGAAGWEGAAGGRARCLDAGRLQGRSGAIQAAINLELHAPDINYIEVKVEGLNGQLPNLDLVNLVHKLCVKSGIHHSFKSSYSWARAGGRGAAEWRTSLRTMLDMLVAQLPGVPTGNHGLFHRWGVSAVSLEGRTAAEAGAGRLPVANYRRLGLALEALLRSLNNLLEAFHQSYFFYMLAATNRFISIGQYMPCLCLLCVAMLVRALYLWVTLQDDDDGLTHTDETDTHHDTNTNDEQTSDTKVPSDHKHQQVKKKAKSLESLSIVSMGANYLLVHLIGYAVMNSPSLIIDICEKLNIDEVTEVRLFYGLVCISVLLAVLSPLLPRLVHRGRMRREEVALLNVVVLLELATACLALGMHNFSLGFVLAVIYTPLALLVGVVTEHDRWWRVWSVRLVCAALCPLAAVCAGMCAYSRLLFPEDALLTAMARAIDAAQQALTFAVLDSMIYGNWLFNVVCTAVVPVWMLFWQILWHPVPSTHNTT